MAWQTRGPPPSPRHVSLFASPPAQINDPCSWKYGPSLVFRKRAWHSVRSTIGRSTLRSSAWYFPSGPTQKRDFRWIRKKPTNRSVWISFEAYRTNRFPILCRSIWFPPERPYLDREDKSAWCSRCKQSISPEREQPRRETIRRCCTSDAWLSRWCSHLEWVAVECCSLCPIDRSAQPSPPVFDY